MSPSSWTVGLTASRIEYMCRTVIRYWQMSESRDDWVIRSSLRISQYQATPETNIDCQKVPKWSMYSMTFCLRSRRMWPRSCRQSRPVHLHQRTGLRQLRHRCLLLRDPRYFGTGQGGVGVLDPVDGYAFYIVANLHVSIEGSFGHDFFGGDLRSLFDNHNMTPT